MSSIERGDTRVLQVIDDCVETYKLCIQTAAYCVERELAAPERLQALYDCADINLVLSNFLSRASRFYRPLASLCIEVSEACAEAIGGQEHGDAQLRVAYAACLRAARSCAELVGKAEEAPADDQRDEAVWESFPASDPPPPPTEI